MNTNNWTKQLITINTIRFKLYYPFIFNNIVEYNETPNFPPVSWQEV